MYTHRVPICGELTVKQQRIVDAVVVHGAETARDAAKIAGTGYTHTARTLAKHGNVKRAIQQRQAEKGDSARTVRLKATRKLSVAIESEEDPRTLTGVAVGMSQVEANVGAEEPDGDPEDARDTLRRLRLRMFLLGVLATTRCGGDVFRASVIRAVEAGILPSRCIDGTYGAGG